MWPFSPGQSKQLIADALAPGVLPSAREKALVALMSLPQNPPILDCYVRIALDSKQVWKVRCTAVDGMKLSPNEDGARALLRCVPTDLRRLALSRLCQGGLPAALQQTGPEGLAVLAGALHQIAADAEAKFSELLLTDLDSLRQLLDLVASPGARDLMPRAQELSTQLRHRLIPKFLERALTSKYHHEVRESLAALERLGSPAAQTALEKFRGAKSRLVEKHVPPGIGAKDDNHRRQVYTSEFGQAKSDEELAYLAELSRDYERRHPKAPPPSAPEPAPPDPAPAPPPNSEAENPWPVVSAQYYAAASARGIEEELLALVADQLEFLKSLHRQGSLAPLAAAMNTEGEISGFALTSKDPGADRGGASEAISLFREQLQAGARQGEIIACAIFYHGCHGPGRGAFQVAPAQNVEEADSIVALLDHCDGQAALGVFQYTAGAGGSWRYAPPYYAPRQPEIFVDPIGMPFAPNHALDSAFPRRPASASDHGTHPELMTLVESHLELLKSLQKSGSLAPVAATLKPAGGVQAMLVVEPAAWDRLQIATDPRDPLVFFLQGEGEKTPAGAVDFFVAKLRTAAAAGEIVASAIFYHGIYVPETASLGIKPAASGEQPDCLVVQLDHRMSQAISLLIRYEWDAAGKCHYRPAEHHPTFPLIFNDVP